MRDAGGNLIEDKPDPLPPAGKEKAKDLQDDDEDEEVDSDDEDYAGNYEGGENAGNGSITDEEIYKDWRASEKVRLEKIDEIFVSRIAEQIGGFPGKMPDGVITFCIEKESRTLLLKMSVDMTLKKMEELWAKPVKIISRPRRSLMSRGVGRATKDSTELGDAAE